MTSHCILYRNLTFAKVLLRCASSIHFGLDARELRLCRPASGKRVGGGLSAWLDFY